jgi:hypothetical protein
MSASQIVAAVPSYSPVPENQEIREVLEELFVLLEEFAPSWYTEDHRRRAMAALQAGSESRSGS